MLLQRFTMNIVILAQMTLLSSPLLATPLTTPLPLTQNVLEENVSNAPASISLAVTKHRNTSKRSLGSPAQNFAARQARLIVSSLVEEAELLSYSPLKTLTLLSEYRYSSLDQNTSQ